MRSFAIVAAVAACLALSACETMDDEDDSSSRLSQADLAYNVCQPSYDQKANTLEGKWAFVSGIDDSGHSSCYWSWKYGSTVDASNASYNDCRKKYDSCFLFATSDGPSDWVRRKSDEIKARRAARNVTLSRVGDTGGDDSDSDDRGGDAGDDGPSLGDFLDGLTDLLNAATGIVQATQGGGGSSGGGFSGGGSVSLPSGNGYSQRGAFDDCAKLFDALGPAAAAQKAECEQRARNMGTAR